MITDINKFKSILENNNIPFFQITNENMTELILSIWSHCDSEVETLDRAPDDWAEQNKEYIDLYINIYQQLSKLHEDMLKLNSIAPKNHN